MLQHSFPMAFLVQLRIVFHSVLHGAAQDPHRFDVPVSLGDDLTVDASGLVAV